MTTRRMVFAALAVLAGEAQAGGHAAVEVAFHESKVKLIEQEVQTGGGSNGKVADMIQSRGSLAGVWARVDVGREVRLRVAARALVGGATNEREADEPIERMRMGEVRALLATEMAGTTVYTGLGYRHVDVGGRRTSRAGYMPLGLTMSGRMGAWMVHTTAEAGAVFWGEETLEVLDVGSTGSLTFAGVTGWQGRLTLEARRRGLLLAPFVRTYKLSETAPETIGKFEYTMESVRATEAGLRVGIGF
ncbi:hypothetical protein [Thiohalorhabdus methylotrophus]|uniref:Outer membrane protein beta-barrel domain-containing protein n=1 Tax=Thiohalorhabdus methylotrophus TaxID=3242694 RepID=A0ABV4TYL3_9GAMM